MKAVVCAMAACLFLAIMVAGYGMVAVEPKALEIAGILGLVSFSPLVLGYGYKGMNAMTKGLRRKQNQPDIPVVVTSIPMNLPSSNADGADSYSQLIRQPPSVSSMEVPLIERSYSQPSSYSQPTINKDLSLLTSVSPETAACPFCGESILTVAKKCKHCGEFLDPLLRQQATAVARQPEVHVQVVRERQSRPAETSNAVAVICSFFWPGLGQMVQGRVGAGIFWMFIVFVGYMFFIIPGLVLHLFCIVDASSFKPT